MSTVRTYDKNTYHRNLPDRESLMNVHYCHHISNTWKPTIIQLQRKDPRSYYIITTDGCLSGCVVIIRYVYVIFSN